MCDIIESRKAQRCSKHKRKLNLMQHVEKALQLTQIVYLFGFQPLLEQSFKNMKSQRFFIILTSHCYLLIAKILKPF